jgi:DNA-binding CsgD family transcriptional regulator
MTKPLPCVPGLRGTVEGWQRHRASGTEVCGECAKARDQHLENVRMMRNPRTRAEHSARNKAALDLASGTPRPASCPLTPREWEVAVLVAQGLGNSAIATELTVSTATVKTQVSSAFSKLGIGNRHALAALMYQEGWLPASLADPNGQAHVPVELFASLVRLAYLVHFGQLADAKVLAKRLAPQLPKPKTKAP